jgi:hypothetical protein
MKPKIDKTSFGSVTIEGKVFTHDVIIRLDGMIKKRKKKLSKSVYGTSHIISLDEAKHVFEKGAKGIIIGSGQSGLVKLSDEASEYFEKKKCAVELLPTKEAVTRWNEAGKKRIGLFHVTC